MIDYFEGVRFARDYGYSELDLQGHYSAGSKLRYKFCDNVNDFVFFWSNRGSTPFHNYMVDFIKSTISPFGSPWVARRLDYQETRSVPDLILFGYYFEAETALKRSRASLIKRLKNSNFKKVFTYVIVPNSFVKANYKASLPVFHGRLYTLHEFQLNFTISF